MTRQSLHAGTIFLSERATAGVWSQLGRSVYRPVFEMFPTTQLDCRIRKTLAHLYYNLPLINNQYDKYNEDENQSTLDRRIDQQYLLYPWNKNSSASSTLQSRIVSKSGIVSSATI